ncbi:MAG TPA: hypothetical protein VN326_01680 [Casimicrobiaceae bacterium]|jgi:hypothetical protein|nr:hypothetical protein [Casimicrobiaceae bacterium]
MPSKGPRAPRFVQRLRTTRLLLSLFTAAATATVIIGLRSAGKADVPGFFGYGTMLADVNVALEVLLVVGLTFGMGLARRGRIEVHRTNQTIWVSVNAALVALIMIGSIRTFKLAHWSDLANVGNLIIVAHAVIGTLTFAAGMWLVLQMNDILPERMHLSSWKTMMRWTLAGYWVVALLGIATYRVWYA